MLLGTMNFLISFLNWGLPVLVYIHAAQFPTNACSTDDLSQAQGSPEGPHRVWGYLQYLTQFSRAAPTYVKEQKSTEVISFMNVYERSVCQVREILVDVVQEYPDEVEYIFKPSCVPLMRCAGCCGDEALECVPKLLHNVTMQILRIKPHFSQLYVEKSFQQHSDCECRPKRELKGKQENHCEPCTDTERRKHLFVQDPQTCKCACKNTDSRCKTRQLELNERTCRCEKPRR
ncbi:vascular endothelial growth factor A, long form isoform X3 [Hyperolius riggenbachi]|uniref:vascular endothelial growth factor A, long form isoform X3 n=1 Tax=Hyperolius riggenbachi TaxID=752182 RepID=UPI0035A2946E